MTDVTPVYFDHKVTTPVDPGVLDAMLLYLRDDYRREMYIRQSSIRHRGTRHHGRVFLHGRIGTRAAWRLASAGNGHMCRRIAASDPPDVSRGEPS